jgi:hypothetical protein
MIICGSGYQSEGLTLSTLFPLRVSQMMANVVLVARAGHGDASIVMERRNGA